MSQSILIVEDAADLRNMYRMALRRLPYPIHLAASGEEALDVLQRQPDIALVLLDLTLPGISGELVLERVRKDSSKDSLKFLVMSGWDDLKQRAAAMGADDFARKPVAMPELEKQVSRILGNATP